MRARPAATFGFVDGLRIEISASRRALEHFQAEYGAARVDPGGEPQVAVAFRPTLEKRTLGFVGGYRSLRWEVELEAGYAGPIRAAIRLRGAPRSFGLSLLQGYVVEPLLALAAPAAGHVLLPAAAVESHRGALILLGRSRSGKSSLVARFAAAGTRVLGDDHVLVGSRACVSFPRRLRLYPDVARTAPGAYALLPGRTRALLDLLGLVRSASGGSVAPPVRIPIEAVGTVARDPLALAGVIVLERRDVRSLASDEVSVDELVATAGMVLREQRRALGQLEDARWRTRLDGVQAAEASLLRSAFSRAPAPPRRLTVPEHLSAGEAVAAIADVLSPDL